METVLNTPCRALINEIKAVPAPGMTYQIVNCTEAVKRSTKLTAEQGMKTLSGGRGRGDFEGAIGAYGTNELIVAFIGPATAGEHHTRSQRVVVSREVRIQVIGF